MPTRTHPHSTNSPSPTHTLNHMHTEFISLSLFHTFSRTVMNSPSPSLSLSLSLPHQFLASHPPPPFSHPKNFSSVNSFASFTNSLTLARSFSSNLVSVYLPARDLCLDSDRQTRLQPHRSQLRELIGEKNLLFKNRLNFWTEVFEAPKRIAEMVSFHHKWIGIFRFKS